MVSSAASRMKRFLSLVLLGAVLSTFNGCAMSDEDKDFYGRGWIRPTDLDNPYPHHSGTEPVKPAAATTSTSTAPLSTTSDPAHDPAWDVVGGTPSQ